MKQIVLVLLVVLVACFFSAEVSMATSAKQLYGKYLSAPDGSVEKDIYFRQYVAALKKDKTTNLPSESADSLYQQYLDTPPASREKTLLYEKYIESIKTKKRGNPLKSKPLVNQPTIVVNQSDPRRQPVYPTKSTYQQYLSEQNPQRKKALFKKYMQEIRQNGSTGTKTDQIGMDGFTKKTNTTMPSSQLQSTATVIQQGVMSAIPKTGYLVDSPQVLPALRSRKKTRGLKGFFRKVEDGVEKTMGKIVTGTMELTYGINKDPALNNRLQRVAAMVDRVHDRNGGIRYKLLNMDVVNAFAAPGGTVYLTPKMLQFVNSDSELAFVVAHEVGHLVSRHSIKQLEKSFAIGYLLSKTKIGDQQAAQIANAFLMLQYSRQDEFEADRLGFEYLSAAGYNPYASVSFMQKMKEKFEQKKSPKIFTYFSTHPSLHDRYNRNMGLYNTLAGQNPLWRKINGQ